MRGHPHRRATEPFERFEVHGEFALIRNDDRPGVIAAVSSIIAEAGVNISDLDVGLSPSGESAMMVLATNRPLTPEIEERLRAADGIKSVHTADIS